MGVGDDEDSQGKNSEDTIEHVDDDVEDESAFLAEVVPPMEIWVFRPA